VKGVVFAMIVGVLLAAGVLMVPVLEHYPIPGVLVTAVLLHRVYLAGARAPGLPTAIPVIALAAIPVVGVAEQALAGALAVAVAVGLGTGVLVGTFSHALFPDTGPAAPAKAPTPVDADAARRGALQATLVILPVFALALTNPAAWFAAILKSSALGQLPGAAHAGTAGRELVGSTLMGAAMAAVVWSGLSLCPTLWMLMLWMVLATLWAGRRLFGVRATRWPPSFWLNALMTMVILLGPAIEDAAVGKDVLAASLTRVALFVGVAVYGWAVIWILERWRHRGTLATSPQGSPSP
jgi:hypothetical protein